MTVDIQFLNELLWLCCVHEVRLSSYFFGSDVFKHYLHLGFFSLLTLLIINTVCHQWIIFRKAPYVCHLQRLINWEVLRFWVSLVGVPCQVSAVCELFAVSLKTHFPFKHLTWFYLNNHQRHKDVKLSNASVTGDIFLQNKDLNMWCFMSILLKTVLTCNRAFSALLFWYFDLSEESQYCHGTVGFHISRFV